MSLIQINDLIINRETYDIVFRNKRFELTRKEFELLYLLASNPYRVFTREEIMKHVWKQDISAHSDRTIDVHVRKLRIKLEEAFIYTIKGIGYKLMNPDTTN